jgi:ABC-type branched-subunit amino acid transport system substrate-binding protein
MLFVYYRVLNREDFYKTFGYPGSNWLAEGAYDDVLFWADGVKQTKATESENLIKALEKIEVDCTRGKMKVNPIDHCSHNYPYKQGFLKF